MWHQANRHPSLPLLIAHVKARYRPCDARGQWLPAADRPLFPAGPGGRLRYAPSRAAGRL